MEALCGMFLLFVPLFAIIVANSLFGDFYVNLWDIPLGVAIGDFIISMPLRLWIND
ncbi:Na+/H+ antiporter NhaA, partial [Aliarcobacter butzleri]|uniref:Na+/H+ antiporter NhaA n=1 Tax=Aliarcobacter butzleri TaxID=28197 RepID=UPI003AF632FC